MVKRSPHPDVVIPELPIHEFILGRIKEYGDATAMVDSTRDEVISFRQMHAQVVKCASALYKQGLRKGDVAAICATNRVEYPVLLLAVAACGGVSSACNPMYTQGELLHQFKISRPVIAFCEPEVLPLVKNIAAELPTLRKVFTFGKIKESSSYESLVQDDDGQAYPSVVVNPREDLFILAYSSGTTGMPKGVMLSHYNVMAQIILVQATLFQARSSCFYMVVPMFHTFGYSATLIQLALGMKNVFDCRFDADRMFQAIEKHKVTHFTAVPPIMLLLAQTELVRKYNVSSLQRMLCSAAPIAPSLITAISDRYKVAVLPCYGMTESTPISMSDPVVRATNSVGSICPNTVVKVLHTETGRELKEGEDGEILVKGPQSTKGYLGNSVATAETIDENGWLHTGDVGHYDSDGMLYIVDRLKELIKYKGYQIPPAELEAVLLTHPDISDAAIIGIPDLIAGEVPKAYVVRKNASLTEKDVQSFVAKSLAHYKHLRGGVEFINVIPKSQSGKILRKELRTRAKL